MDLDSSASSSKARLRCASACRHRSATLRTDESARGSPAIRHVHGPAQALGVPRPGCRAGVAYAQGGYPRRRLPRARPATTLESELGPVAVEDVMDELGSQLRSQLQPGDIAGRVSARGFAYSSSAATRATSMPGCRASCSVSPTCLPLGRASLGDHFLQRRSDGLQCAG